MSNLTSVSKTLRQITSEVEKTRKSLVDDTKKSKRDFDNLPETLSQKEKIDYLHKVQPHLDQIYELTKQGYTKANIAKVLGISVDKFRHLTREIPELRRVLELGVEDKIDAVEASLYQLALGYEVEEQVINPFDGSKETVTKYQAPVLGAIKYVLSNKRAEEYADKRQIIKKVELGTEIKDALMSLSTNDLQLLLQMANSEHALDATFTESGNTDGSQEEN